MKLVLKPELFTNNKYYCRYGKREAQFTIVDEEFAGNGKLGRINRIVVLVRDSNTSEARLCTTVIGLGDGYVGVQSEVPELKGQLLNKDNMSDCVIHLFEGE